jgi:hypothetical protein
LIIDCSNLNSEQLNTLLDQAYGTEICLLINSNILKKYPGVIELAHHQGLEIFADLTISEITEIVSSNFYNGEDSGIASMPDMITIASSASLLTIAFLKEKLPETKLIGACIPSPETKAPRPTSIALTNWAKNVCLDGALCKAEDLKVVHKATDENNLSFYATGAYPEKFGMPSNLLNIFANDATRVIMNSDVITKTDDWRKTIIQIVAEIKKAIATNRDFSL